MSIEPTPSLDSRINLILTPIHSVAIGTTNSSRFVMDREAIKALIKSESDKAVAKATLKVLSQITSNESELYYQNVPIYRAAEKYRAYLADLTKDKAE